LLSINPTTAAATPISGLISGRVIRAAAFDAADRLWVVDKKRDELLQIDPSNGQIIGAPVPITLNGDPLNKITLNGHPLDISDIAVRSDGTFFATNSSAGTVFYNLRISTGVLTQVAADRATEKPAKGSVRPTGLGLASVGDAAFTYDAKSQDDIFKYDTAAAFARSLVLKDIISEHHPGGFNRGQVISRLWQQDPRKSRQKAKPLRNTAHLGNPIRYEPRWQHFLNFFPLPHGQGSLRPTRGWPETNLPEGDTAVGS
jgi:hypothetical protein